VNAEHLVHEVIARYRLKYQPVRLSLARIKNAKRVEEIISGIDSKIKSRASDVQLLSVDNNQVSNTLTYKATTGNGEYTVKIRAVPADGSEKKVWEAKDVYLSCSCRHWRYGGCEHHAKKGDYLYAEDHPRGTLGKPNIRDPEGNNYVCKHVYRALQEAKKVYIDY